LHAKGGPGEPDDRRVSHICSRYPGLLVEAAFNFALAAPGGAASLHSRRKVPARVPRVLVSCLSTRAGEEAMMAPAGWAAALHASAERAAAGEAPRRTRDIALGAPIVMPIWLEFDRNGRMSGRSHAAATPCG